MALQVKIDDDKGSPSVTGLAATGSRSTGALATTTTYTLTATSDAGQTATAQRTVQVGALPTINFTVNGGASAAVLAGGTAQVTLAWDVTGAASVKIEAVAGTPAVVNPNNVSGTAPVTPTGTAGATTTYTLTATSSLGLEATATVTVYTDAVPTVTSFTTNRTVIAPAAADTGNKNATLTWVVSNAASVSIVSSPTGQGGGSGLGLSSNTVVAPTVETTYTLQAITSHGAVYTYPTTRTISVESLWR